jgi:alpha-galactosidase
MIKQQDNLFILETSRTSYLFRVAPWGHLEHLYYGEKLDLSGGYDCLVDPHTAPGNAISYSPKYPVCLENVCLEVSAPGHGDLRQPTIAVETDYGFANDFQFQSAEIRAGKPALPGLPSSYVEHEEGETLAVTLKDQQAGLTLTLFWAVLEDCDIISRWGTLENSGNSPVTIRRFLSNQLDLEEGDYEFLTWKGTWGREMGACVQPVGPGRLVNESTCGASSSRANPFVVVKETEATEVSGTCYGFHLLYSGNHMESVEENSFGRVRVLQGIHPQGFGWKLEPGDSFTCPEAAMTCSTTGLEGIRLATHRFIRKHIVRGQWRDQPRPVLINSWESFYFNFNESKLLRLAKDAKKLGIELFVLDDGWFGQRDDDTSSLGDWQENRQKLPSGLSGLCQKINDLGMDFGLWVEPETVNICSELYRTHPDWILGHVEQSDGRNELLLDLGRNEVQDWLIDTLSGVFSCCNLSYVKWDMNRIFSDTYSSALPLERQGEVAHRYQLGLYRVLDTLTKRFPHILFEGCASGGNRFDCGMLCYFPQIWASDNTDVLSRFHIQDGYLLGYPQSTLGCHVSTTPNHQTLRVSPLESRFQVAAFGLLGYELDLGALTGEEKAAVAAQVALYKARRMLFQYGQIYHRMSAQGPVWTVVSPDKGSGAALLFSDQTKTNGGITRLPLAGLDPSRTYHLSVRRLRLNLKSFGSLVNAVSPINIQQNSLRESLAAKVIKLQSEEEEHSAKGQVLMKGVKLKPAFNGTGYHSNTRVMLDYDSRLYFIDEVD